jgi:hypothetical protein
MTAGISPPATAQSADQPAPADAPTAAETSAIGTAPTAPARTRPFKRRAAALAPRTTGPVATFPGYHALPDGRTQVYVEITSSVPVAESVAPGTITYRLKGARVTVRNNKNALITTHFPATPVARARLVPADNDLNLIIELRANVTATYRMVSSEAGTARLEVEFPAGKYPTELMRFMPPKDVAKKAAKAEPGSSDTVDDGADTARAAEKPKKKQAKPKAKGMGPPVP